MPALDFDAFRRQLVKGDILPAYYFHGDEDFLKDEAVREVLTRALDSSSRDFNLDRRRAPDLTVEEFQTLALTPPMLAARRAVVITEVEALQQRRPRAQALRAAVLRFLTGTAGDTLLLLVQSSGEPPDPDVVRAAAAVQVDPLEPERVRKWIVHRVSQEGLTIEDAAARHLQESVGDDLAQLAAELAKLRSAVSGRAIRVADVADLVGVRRGETAHDFADAVTARRFTEAAAMVTHLLETPGTSGVRLVGQLGTMLTGVAYARALLDGGTPANAVTRRIFETLRAARPMGLRNWNEEAARWASAAERWTAAELDAALDALLRADRRLKNVALGGEADLVRDVVLGMAARGERAA
jgi:DNA polymerase-3 subunit delta